MASLSLKEVYFNESGKGFKLLYHIGKRPAAPKPSKRPSGDWDRPWLKKPITEPAVFMTDDWMKVRAHHGRWGNIYSYKIPRVAIKAAGGLHTYDRAKEIVFTQTVWDKFGLSKTQTNKVIDADEVEDIIRDKRGHGSEADIHRLHFGNYASQEKRHLPPRWETLLNKEPSKQRETIKLLGKEEAERVLDDLQHWLKTAEPPEIRNKDKAYERLKQAMVRNDFKEKLDKALALEKVFKTL